MVVNEPNWISLDLAICMWQKRAQLKLTLKKQQQKDFIGQISEKAVADPGIYWICFPP